MLLYQITYAFILNLASFIPGSPIISHQEQSTLHAMLKCDKRSVRLRILLLDIDGIMMDGWNPILRNPYVYVADSSREGKQQKQLRVTVKSFIQ